MHCFILGRFGFFTQPITLYVKYLIMEEAVPASLFQDKGGAIVS